VKGLLVAGALLFATLPALAHHSIAAEYNFDKEVTVKGVLTRMDWVNPHPLMMIEVTEADGKKTTWIFQTAQLGSGPSAQLRKAPSQGGLKPGETYTAIGFAAKNGKPQAFLKAVTMPDGKLVTTWFGDPNG
jgi:hypothetical protein